MQDQQRKPICPKCNSTNVTYIGDNSDVADRILHPEVAPSLVRAYQCECGTAFTFTVPMPPKPSGITGR